MKSKDLSSILTKLLPDFVADLTSSDLYELVEITAIGLLKEDNQLINRRNN